jgi:TolA-binding protein
MRRVGGCLLALTVIFPLSAHADVQSGVAAYSAGNYAVAFAELKPLADGNAEASYLVGMMYEQGHGVVADDTEAVRAYRVAANLGHANAQYLLGVHTQTGLGTSPNKVEAYKWLVLAQRGGVVAAQQFLGSFIGSMSPEEIAAATAMIDALCNKGDPACRPTQSKSMAPPQDAKREGPVSPDAKPTDKQAAVAQVPPPVEAVPMSGTLVAVQQTAVFDRPNSNKRVGDLRPWERVTAIARTRDDWFHIQSKASDGWVTGRSMRDEPAAEKLAWSRVKPGDIPALKAFVDRFPNGAHYEEALVKLDTALAVAAEGSSAQALPKSQPPALPSDRVASSKTQTPKAAPSRRDQVSETASLNRAELGENALVAVTEPVVASELTTPTPSADPPRVAMATPPSGDTGPILMSGTTFEHYDQAMRLMNDSNYAAAEAVLKEIVTNHHDDPVAEKAEYRLGEIYFRRGEYQAAADTFGRFRSAYPHSANDPLALMNYARSLGRLGRTSEACQAFRSLGTEYPGLSGEAKEQRNAEIQQLHCGRG